MHLSTLCCYLQRHTVIYLIKHIQMVDRDAEMGHSTDGSCMSGASGVAC